jgi:hypothetical protein
MKYCGGQSKGFSPRFFSEQSMYIQDELEKPDTFQMALF